MTAGVLAQTGAQQAAAASAGIRSTVWLLDDDSLAMWQDCEKRFSVTPYQSASFAHAWLAAHDVTLRQHLRLLSVHDRQGQIIMILPFLLDRFAMWRVAKPIAGNHCNFMAPLFDARACADLGAADLRCALIDGLFKAGADLAYLPHVPAAWLGHTNPLVLLDHRASANPARQAQLSADVPATLKLLRSKDSMRKLAAKKRKLAVKGQILSGRADLLEEKLRLLSAYRSLKDRWSQQRRITNEFSDQSAVKFYHALAPDPDFLLWFLRLDDEVIGVAGGLRRGHHFSMMIISSEQDAFAACSPGDILVQSIICDLCVAGYTSVDFGTGDAEYKRRWLPEALTLLDVIHPLTFGGQIAGILLGMSQMAKSFVKARPRLTRFMHGVSFRQSPV